MGSERQGAAGDSTLAALCHRALPLVYGYLLLRCGSAALAEDLTADTFTAAVAAAKRDHPPDLTVAWLVGVARHKLGVNDCDAEPAEDPWDAQLDVAAAHAALSRLSAHHRAALPGWPAGGRGRRGTRPQPARHRDAPGQGPGRVPPRLRKGARP